MRINFLSVIASLFIASLVITSCLNTDDNYEYSSDDTITAFELDTIYSGVKYKFTIDQLGNEVDEKGRGIGRIFNTDSVPFSADTIINKILITKITTSGYIGTGGATADKDTLLILSDSVDLSKAMTEPLVFRVRSYADPESYKTYKLYLNIHRQDPDTLIWHKTPEAQPTGLAGAKVDTLGNNLLAFTSYQKVLIRDAGDGSLWQEKTINTLPTDTRLASILNYKNVLYATTGSGKMFCSANGFEWSELTSNKTAVDLLTPFQSFIAGIINDGAVNKFATATISADGKSVIWAEGNIVPDDFPKENISTTHVFLTNTGLWRAFIVGKSANDDVRTTPWATNDGKVWGKIETTSTYYAPAMEKPSIIYYGKKFYIFGGDFSTFYGSENGVTWQKVEDKFLFPKEFKDRSQYSMVMDKNKYIWMIWGSDTWKGRQNKVVFKIQ